jgi:hypothetical protein
MHPDIDFECSDDRQLPVAHKKNRGARMRNAIARKKIERRLDRQRLRRWLEEVWS